MHDEDIANRVTSLESAVAHLTEAVEELVKAFPAGTSPSVSLVQSHLRDIRENFNRLVPRVGPG